MGFLTEDDVERVRRGFARIQQYTNKDGLLDHAVRAVEEYLIASEFSGKGSFRIKKCPLTRASTYCYYNPANGVAGATLSYPSSLSTLDESSADWVRNLKRMYIGHELGHLVMKHVSFRTSKRVAMESGSTNDITDEKKENEATYFGMLLLQDRAEFFGNSEKTREFVLKNDEINDLAERVHKGYSGRKLVIST